MAAIAGSVQDYLCERIAEARDGHVRQTRLLTAHYIRHLSIMEAECKAAQEARLQEFEALKVTKCALEEQVEELEKQKRELKGRCEAIRAAREQEQNQAETENEQLEETMIELEARVEEFEREKEESGKRIEELERENEELEEKMDELERGRSILKREKAQLDAKNAKLDRHAQIWRDRYRETFMERVALKQQFRPPPILPIELLTTVAGFVAGSNDFSTLAALCRTSRLMSQECTSYLYETIIWTEDLQECLLDCKAKGDYPAAWRYTRFIIVEGEHVKFLSRRAFPNNRVTIVKRMTSKTKFNNRAQSSSELSVRLSIKQAVASSTLKSILECPLEWIFAAGFRVWSAAKGITLIQLSGDSYLLPGDSTYDNRLPIMPGLAAFLIRQTGPEDRTRDSIRELCRQLSLNGPRTAREQDQHAKDELHIKIRDQEDLQLWTQELPNALRMRPTLHLKLEVVGKMTMDFVSQQMTGFSRLYEGIWPIIRAGRANLRHANLEFFVLDNSADWAPSGTTSYRIAFQSAPPTERFHVVVERSTIGEDELVDTVVVHHEEIPRPVLEDEDEKEQVMSVEDEGGDADDESDLTELSSDGEEAMI